MAKVEVIHCRVRDRSRGRKSPISWSQKVRHQWQKSPKKKDDKGNFILYCVEIETRFMMNILGILAIKNDFISL